MNFGFLTLSKQFKCWLSILLFFLPFHHYRFKRAIPSAEAAAFAVVQVAIAVVFAALISFAGRENNPFGADIVANRASRAFVVQEYGPKSPPVAGFILYTFTRFS